VPIKTLKNELAISATVVLYTQDDLVLAIFGGSPAQSTRRTAPSTVMVEPVAVIVLPRDPHL
jgi:hypothetical protein